MGAEIGMLVVETIAKIRRAYFVHGQPIKAICRDLGVSRKVVRKVIRSEATEFRYEREAQPLPRIGPWSEKLDQLLSANEGKASRERLTLIRLFEELRGCGYAGGYDAVRRYARRWRKERGGVRVSLDFDRGCDANAFQPLAVDMHVLDREQQQAAANEECCRSQHSSLGPGTDDLAKPVFFEAIGKDLLAAAGATVDKHGDRLAPLHVPEFAGAIAISDLHCRRSRVEQIKILGNRAAPAIAQVPDQRVGVVQRTLR